MAALLIACDGAPKHGAGGQASGSKASAPDKTAETSSKKTKTPTDKPSDKPADKPATKPVATTPSVDPKVRAAAIKELAKQIRAGGSESKLKKLLTELANKGENARGEIELLTVGSALPIGARRHAAFLLGDLHFFNPRISRQLALRSREPVVVSAAARTLALLGGAENKAVVQMAVAKWRGKDAKTERFLNAIAGAVKSEAKLSATQLRHLDTIYNSRDKKRVSMAGAVLMVDHKRNLDWAVKRMLKLPMERDHKLTVIALQRSVKKHAGPASASASSSSVCTAGAGAACVRAGERHLDGKGVPKDANKAGKAFRMGCDAGDAIGCRLLGYLFATGEGGHAKDLTKAAALYRQACDKRDSSGCSNLGIIYARGQGGLAGGHRAAFPYFLRACVMLNAQACFYVGHAYETGTGGKTPSKTMARTWYRKSCKLGYRRACRK